MKFVAIYRNDATVREQVIGMLNQAIAQGNDLERGHINHPLFSTRITWPDLQTLMNLPLSMQCEMLDCNGQQCESLRVQVIDVEMNVQLIAEEVKANEPNNN